MGRRLGFQELDPRNPEPRLPEKHRGQARPKPKPEPLVFPLLGGFWVVIGYKWSYVSPLI